MRRQSANPPLVIWRRRGCCRSRLLRVTLSPRGWHIIGEDFRVKPAEWQDRVDPAGDHDLVVSRANREMAILNFRRVRGVNQWLPLDVETWQPAEFEIGCDHATTKARLADLVEDCLKARHQQARVERAVPAESS